MYKIIKKKLLGSKIVLMDIEAPDIAKKCNAGQFIILRINENGERIPLTIADFDNKKGIITIVIQEVGYTSKKICSLKENDEFIDFVGPLGKETKIKKYGKIICVGGGVGVAPIFPIARSLKNAGNEVISIIGARSKDFLIWEDKMKKISNKLYITTDDGSAGEKGIVIDIIKKVIKNQKINHLWAIGPVIMMKFVSILTKEYNIPTTVSMNPIMVDGTGMCGACRLEVDGKIKFACVDGPEFDGHKVNWDLALKRMNIYREKEKISINKYKKEEFKESKHTGGF